MLKDGNSRKSVSSTRDSLPIPGTASFQTAGTRFASEIVYQSELVPAGLLLLPPARSGWLSEPTAGVYLCETSSVLVRRIA